MSINQSHSKLAALDAVFTLIDDPDGQAQSIFTKVYREPALLAAEMADRMEGTGQEPSPLAGVSVSIKDLFDVRGEVTLAGSKALAIESPAEHDAEIVRRLRRAGAAIVGKTNMTEFAFSGLGLNPHYGTPLCIWDRNNARIPGGSSSGAAISVTDGMAEIAIGTDTGGSCRVPAALNGIVGFKPTARTVPKTGAFPLSYTYDSIGPIARDTTSCALAYSVLSDSQPEHAMTFHNVTLGVIRNYVLEDMDNTVAATFEATLSTLSRAGVILHEIELDTLNQLPSLLAQGGISGAEAYQIHRHRLATQETIMDPRVVARIRLGESITAADYMELAHRRAALVEQFNARIYGYDAIVMPTVPRIAPRIAELSDDDTYVRTNLLMLRNTSVANMMDACSISLPCQAPGKPPVGLMLTGRGTTDWRLLRVARVIETILNVAFDLR